MPVPEWIFLPVLVGYFFFHASKLFRYRSRRLDGPRIVLECALWGGLFFVLGRLMTFWLHQVPWGHLIEQRVGALPLPFVGTTLVAGLLAGFVAVLLDLLISKARALDWASPSATLQNFLRTAAVNSDVIAVTLDTRKVYIGFITEVPTLDPHDTHIAILPVLSGYRQGDTLEMRITSNYAKAYQQASDGPDPTHFTVYLPISSIRIARRYDTEVDPQIFSEKSIIATES